MPVHLIPAFDDNYIFSLQTGTSSMIVDPGSAQEVFDHLKKNHLKLELIIVTHHHYDHMGGVHELQEKTGAKLFGPSSLAAKNLLCDRVLKQGDVFNFHDFTFATIEVPGHTLDHLAFVGPGILFCGDTLFSLGCGRLFEGSFAMMHGSLSKFQSLPDSTQVYCAHEYTMTNLNFSIQFLQNQGATPDLIAEYLTLQNDLKLQRSQGIPTIPSTLQRERNFNLFLTAKTVEDFQKVREARNKF